MTCESEVAHATISVAHKKFEFDNYYIDKVIFCNN